MLSNVNNNQPSFHSMYVLKGSAKNVRTASEMIVERCGGEYAKLREITTEIFGKPKPEKPYEGFNDFESLNLVNINSDNQPMVHKLIATNEHVPNIRNWYLAMRPPQPNPVDKLMRKVMFTQNGVLTSSQIQGFIDITTNKMQELSKKMEPYLEAERAAKNGNMDKMSAFIIKSMQEIKQRLQEVQELATVPYDEPIVLKAKDVIDAIKNNRFNYVTGEIIK